MRLSRPAVVVCTLVLGAALSSCSGGGEPGDDPSSASSDASSASTSPTDEPTSDVATEPGGGPGVKSAQGAVSDLQLGRCSTKSGRQTVSGKVTSSADKTVDYVITLHWTNDEASGVGDGFRVLRGVAPGETKKFTVKAVVGKGATKCIPHVVYGQVANS